MARIIFLLVFVIPLAIFSGYLVFYSTDMYDSRASVIITEERNAAQTVDLTFLGLPSQSNDRDALVLETFILSRDLIVDLDKKLDFKKHFSDPRADWWHRFNASSSVEDLVAYMQYNILVEYDVDAKVLDVSVRSFDREYSKLVLDEIIAKSQSFMDALNERVAAYQTRFFEQQLTRAEQRLRGAKQEMVDFQRTNKLLTVQAEGDVILQNVGGLEKILVQKQSELYTQQQTLSANAPQLADLKNQIDSIKQQLVLERERLSGGSAASVTELDARYREILLNLEFVTNIYKSNLTQLEQMKFEAAQRQKFLIVVSAPSIADESGYPNRLYAIITAAIILLVAYFVVSLMTAVLRERA